MNDTQIGRVQLLNQMPNGRATQTVMAIASHSGITLLVCTVASSVGMMFASPYSMGNFPPLETFSCFETLPWPSRRTGPNGPTSCGRWSLWDALTRAESGTRLIAADRRSEEH